MARRIRKVVTLLLAASVAALTVGIAVVVFVLPRVTHGEALTVLTGSMQPTIPPGSLVFARPVDPRDVHKGDVITFAVKSTHYGTALVTHRVVAIKYALDAHGDYQREFVTQGDANNAPDTDPVLPQNVRGVMWFHLPYIGGIRDAVHTKAGFAGIAMILLVCYAAAQLVRAYRDRRSPAVEPDVQHAAAMPEWVLTQLQSCRYLTVAQFSSTSLDGLAPLAAARLLGGELVAESADTFTVLYVADAARSSSNQQILAAMSPLMLWSNWAGPDLESAPLMSAPVKAGQANV